MDDALPDPVPGVVRCLRCLQRFRSSDRRRERLCLKCGKDPEPYEPATFPAPRLEEGPDGE